MSKKIDQGKSSQSKKKSVTLFLSEEDRDLLCELAADSALTVSVFLARILRHKKFNLVVKAIKQERQALSNYEEIRQSTINALESRRRGMQGVNNKRKANPTKQEKAIIASQGTWLMPDFAPTAEEPAQTAVQAPEKQVTAQGAAEQSQSAVQEHEEQGAALIKSEPEPQDLAKVAEQSQSAVQEHEEQGAALVKSEPEPQDLASAGIKSSKAKRSRAKKKQ